VGEGHGPSRAAFIDLRPEARQQFEIPPSFSNTFDGSRPAPRGCRAQYPRANEVLRRVTGLDRSLYAAARLTQEASAATAASPALRPWSKAAGPKGSSVWASHSASSANGASTRSVMVLSADGGSSCLRLASPRPCGRNGEAHPASGAGGPVSADVQVTSRHQTGPSRAKRIEASEAGDPERVRGRKYHPYHQIRLTPPSCFPARPTAGTATQRGPRCCQSYPNVTDQWARAARTLRHRCHHLSDGLGRQSDADRDGAGTTHGIANELKGGE
jgi:hypothetical protein